MATFVSLVNLVLVRMNEVTLDTGGDGFTSVRNVQALAKDAVNNSIREILQYNQEWPFTLTTKTETMVVGTGTYDFPSDLNKVDWDSFYLKRLSSAENTPKRMRVISYNDYLRDYRPAEDIGGSSNYAVPDVVFQTQEGKFGVTPIPNAEYEIEYKYWSYPSDLSLYNESPVIPDRFKHVIVDGAMMYMMNFRSNEQQAQIHAQKFNKGIEDMRGLLLDSPQYLSSTVLVGNTAKGMF